MIDLEQQVRAVLRREADAMEVPDADPGHHVARLTPMARRPRRAPMALAAAVVLVVAAGSLALVQRGSGSGEAPGSASDVIASTPTFESPTVMLRAESVEVLAAGRSWTPTADLQVNSDPGMLNEYTTLELTWHDHGIEQRVYIYFTSDGTDWWADEIRTYDGSADGEWVEPAAVGEYFRSPLGSAFVGDLTLPNLRIVGMTLEAFRRPTVCDNPTAPIALVADYPVIDSWVAGFGASFQVVDTATCEALPVAPYTFEYTSQDPALVSIDPPEVIDDYPETKTRVGLQLLAPGTTTVLATARDASGEVVGTAAMHVSIRPSDDPLATNDTTAAVTHESVASATVSPDR